MPGTDYYRVLGVERTATGDEIKRAYRQAAKKHHPDKNPGDRAAEERFKAISAAGDVLTDPEKRKRYDEFGEDGLRQGFDPERARAAAAGFGGGGFGGGDFYPGDIFGGTHGGRVDFDLGDLFGGRVPQPDPRGRDVRAPLTLELLDALRGTPQDIGLERLEPCEGCAGSGRDGGPAPCSACGGQGHRVSARGPVRLRQPCRDCEGSGLAPGPACRRCGGRAALPRTVRLRVAVPAGVASGQTIRLAGQGEPGDPPGDLLLEVTVRPHPRLERRGRDLFADLPLTVGEALRGGDVRVPTLDGDVTLKVPPGAQSGQSLRLRGKGVPAHGAEGAGDFYYRVAVRVPDAADVHAPEVQAAVQTLEQAYRGEVRRDLVFFGPPR